jgi:hypothetical protein
MTRFAPFFGTCAILALLAGCVETVTPPPIAVVPPSEVVPPSGEDTCGLAAARMLIALDASAVATLPRSGPVRVIAPDQPVTLDFNAERLNVFTNAAGQIQRVTCG